MNKEILTEGVSIADKASNKRDSEKTNKIKHH